MIRTSFSCFTLCTCLFLVSRLIHQSIAAEKSPPSDGPVEKLAFNSPYITAFEIDSVEESTSETELDESESVLSETTIDTETVTGSAISDTVQTVEELATEIEETTTTKTTDEATTESVLTKDVAPAKTTLGPAKATTSNIVAIPKAPELTPELLELRERVRDTLGYYYGKHENVVEHSPWGIMHVLIAYGVDTQVIGNGRKMNAIGWLCWNGTCRGQQLFYLQNGRIQTRIGGGVQGHEGQFLAMMAQSRVKSDYPMNIEGRDFTVADLIEYEKRTCVAGTELTFKLIGLAHYLDSNTTWRNEAGEQWSIPRLIKEEMAQTIVGAACGGTHRMMGFTYAVRKREKEGRPIEGQWKRAQKYLDDYFEYTFYLQNEDGSFSTDFFRGRNSYGDIDRRIETTGHILEWFVASLPDSQLRDPRVIKSVNYLTNLMWDNRHHEWEIGPKGHALHALAIYSERVFNDKPGQRDEILARGKKLSTGSQRR